MLCSVSGGIWAKNAAVCFNHFGSRWTSKRGIGTANLVTPVTALSKIEIFVDDKKVLVDPGMTILQVLLFKLLIKIFFVIYRLVLLLVLIFHVFAIMIAFQLLEIVACV